MRRALFVVVLATLAALAGVPAVAQTDPTVEVVATGLQNPRGLDFGADGVLYVAEAGGGAADPAKPDRRATPAWG